MTCPMVMGCRPVDMVEVVVMAVAVWCYQHEYPYSHRKKVIIVTAKAITGI